MTMPTNKPATPSKARPEARQDAKPADRPGGAPAAAPPSALRTVFKAVFVDQLRVRIGGPRVTFALESAPKPAAPAVVETPSVQMRRALTELLDSGPGTRAVFKHLQALESYLEHREVGFMATLSLPTLRRMLQQLNGLITPPPSAGAALLLAELLDAVELRTQQEQVAALSMPISSFFVDHKLEVNELSESTLAAAGLLDKFDGFDLQPDKAGQARKP